MLMLQLCWKENKAGWGAGVKAQQLGNFLRYSKVVLPIPVIPAYAGISFSQLIAPVNNRRFLHTQERQRSFKKILK